MLTLAPNPIGTPAQFDRFAHALPINPLPEDEEVWREVSYARTLVFTNVAYARMVRNHRAFDEFTRVFKREELPVLLAALCGSLVMLLAVLFMVL